MNSQEIDKLNHKIIGYAMEVPYQLKNGFQEMIYQRSLAIEFGLQGILYEREVEMELMYKNEHVGTRRVDFLVEGLVMLEIKAIEKLDGVHIAQAINYCEAYNIPDGLLTNFGAQSLQFHRVFNKKLKS